MSMSTRQLPVSDRVNLHEERLPMADVLGVGVHAVNIPSAIQTIRIWIETRRTGYICVTGVHGIMEAHRNPAFRDALSNAAMVVPDGMPTVWVGRWQGHPEMQRVFGPDLMFELCRESVAAGYTHFFYGGKSGVADQLAANLSASIPGLKVVGTETPPFRPLNSSEKLAFRRRVDQLNPDIVWVGLSTPKQELFMADNIAELNCRVMIGVGAAFDFHTGRLKDSPQWMKTAGLQWLHRLYQEPSRLWKRYLVNNFTFIARLSLHALGLRAYELENMED
jgi:N-acetylglucosaminyldiphosphoundecaprenol N-acetyl-beta-D-mannosaminyltransferase